MRMRRLINISCEEEWINKCLPGQYLADTTMWHTQLSRYVTRPDSLMCHVHDSLSDDVRQGTTVHEHTTQLIDSSVTLTHTWFQVISLCYTNAAFYLNLTYIYIYHQGFFNVVVYLFQYIVWERLFTNWSVSVVWRHQYSPIQNWRHWRVRRGQTLTRDPVHWTVTWLWACHLSLGGYDTPASDL